jgi:RNA polymerase sigma-70 factor (ECF subfamily)
MADDHTSHLQCCLDRLRAGDESARNELVQHACGRLERLARKMLGDYPHLKRWEDTGDVLQNALVRLCRALQHVTPPAVEDFFRLAALQIRRELRDLARHYFGPEGPGTKHASDVVKEGSTGSWHPAYEQAYDSGEPSRLALWREFHEQIESLPDEERAVVDLLWYQGLTQAEVANLLNISAATVKRRWMKARLRLQASLSGELLE